jgi:methionine sulfoxide reductase catalytic subunit
MYFLKDRGFVHPHAADITPQGVYEGRRDLLKLLATGAAGATLATWAGRDALAQTVRPNKLAALGGVRSAVPGAITMEMRT